MQRRTNLTHLILASVIGSGLTPLMVTVDAQARIAFESDRDGHILNNFWAYEIYVMDNDGGNQRNLTNNPADDRDPSWSPDGKRIVFMSNRDGHAKHGWLTSDIFVMDNEGDNQRNLTNNDRFDVSPSWSPDGKRIAFVGNGEIYVMDADGGNQQRLTENRNGDQDPVWSPDSKRIAFMSNRAGNMEIYVIDADGRNQRNLTNNDRFDEDPSWSPDGKRIAFTSWRNGENREIYVMDADGHNQRNLTNHPDADWHPVWSPDGKRIAFVSNRTKDLNRDIFVMDADGSNPRNLTNHPNDDENPAWYHPVLSVAPARKTLTIWGQLKQVNR